MSDAAVAGGEGLSAGSAFDAAWETEAPETTEAPTAAEPSPQPEEVEKPEPAASGKPRDGQGRFAKRDAQAAPQAEEAEAAAPPASEEPTPEQTEPAAEEVTEPEYQPVAIRADGKTLSVEGSAETPDGLYFGKASSDRVKQLIANGLVYEGSYNRKLQESGNREKSAVSRAEAAEAQSAHIMGKLLEMMERGTLAEWLEDQHRNLPILVAEAKAKSLEKQLEARSQGDQERTKQQQDAELRPKMERAIEAEIMEHGQKAGLDRETMVKLYNRLTSDRFRNVLFSQAQEDDQVNGITKGTWLVDRDAIRDEVQHHADLLSRTKTEATKLATAAKVNQKVIAPPPAAGSKTAAPATAKQAKPTPKFSSTREAVEHVFNEGWKDL